MRTSWRRASTVLLLSVVGLLAVPGRADEATKADPMSVAKAYLAAWNAHDADAAAALLAEQVTYYDAAVGKPVKGRAAARDEVIKAFLRAAPDCNWTLNTDADPVVTDDAVVFQWTFAGTNTGPWADGTKATGKPFTFGGATILKVHSGKITYQGDFYDSYGFFKQLGLAQ